MIKFYKPKFGKAGLPVIKMCLGGDVLGLETAELEKEFVECAGFKFF